jgi:hypothetical protein
MNVNLYNWSTFVQTYMVSHICKWICIKKKQLEEYVAYVETCVSIEYYTDEYLLEAVFIFLFSVSPHLV